jgi:DNA-binding response OmpR family regulator
MAAGMTVIGFRKKRGETLTIPWLARNLPAQPTMTPSNIPPPLILIVEDDESIRQLLEFMFQREGYDTVAAADAREAEQAIAHGKVAALAVLDVMLPYADGFHLVAAIRSNPGWQGTPIIMLTAKSSEQDIVKALEAGADDYVLKPFQPMELMARVKRLIKNVT